MGDTNSSTYITMIRNPVDIFVSAWEYYKMGGSYKMTLGKEFLNLPIWANFVDPTDLSPTYLLLLPIFRANQFYRMDSTSASTSAAWLGLVEVEDEVESIL